MIAFCEERNSQFKSQFGKVLTIPMFYCVELDNNFRNDMHAQN